MDNLAFFLVLFCALGGAFVLYALALLLAGVGYWRYGRRLSVGRWFLSAIACLALAIVAHWFTITRVPHIFAGAITG